MSGVLTLPTMVQKFRLDSSGFDHGAKNIESNTKKIGSEFQSTAKKVEHNSKQMASEFNKSASKMEKKSHETSREVGLIGGAIKKLAFAGSAVGAFEFLKGAAEAAREGARAMRLTNAVIKSTGGIAHVSAQGVAELSQKLSLQSGVQDDVIQSGANLLLTFTKVRNQAGEGNDVFDRGTQAALNMSAALGTSLSGANIMLGKALNDPIKGITALTRAGVSFTAEQKDQIKVMVKAGDTLGAQKMILKELGTEFGGAAAAAADPIAKLKAQWHAFQEEIGKFLLPMIGKAADWIGVQLPKVLERAKMYVEAFKGAFLNGDITSGGLVGGIERAGILAHWLKQRLASVMGFIKEHKSVFIDLGKAIVVGFLAFKLYEGTVGTARKVAAAVQGMAKAFGLLAAEEEVANAAMLWIVAIGVAFYMAYKHIKPFHDWVDRLANQFKKWLIPLLREVKHWLMEHKQQFIAVANAIENFTVKAFEKLLGVGKKVVHWLMDHKIVLIGLLAAYSPVLAVVVLAITKWDKLVLAFKFVVGWVKMLVATFKTGGLSGLFHKLGEEAGELGGLIARGLGAILSKIGDFAVQAAQKLADWAGQAAEAIGGWITSAIEWLIPKLGEWIAAFAGWLFGTAIPWLIEKGIAIVAAITGWILGAIVSLVAALPGWIAHFSIWLFGTAIPWLIAKGAAVAGAILGWIVKAVINLPAKLVEFIAKFGVWIVTEGIPKLVVFMAKMGAKLIGWIKDEIPKLPRQLLAFIEGIGHWVVHTGVPKVVEIAKQLGAGILKGIVFFFKHAPGAIGDFAKSIVNAAIDLLNKGIGAISVFGWNPPKHLIPNIKHKGGMVDPSLPATAEVPVLAQAGEYVLSLATMRQLTSNPTRSGSLGGAQSSSTTIGHQGKVFNLNVEGLHVGQAMTPEELVRLLHKIDVLEGTRV